MPNQKPTAIFKSLEGQEFRHASGVSTPHKLQLGYLVFKYAEGREFRRESEVLAFIGSSDASHCHCNLVTVGAV